MLKLARTTLAPAAPEHDAVLAVTEDGRRRLRGVGWQPDALTWQG